MSKAVHDGDRTRADASSPSIKRQHPPTSRNSDSADDAEDAEDEEVSEQATSRTQACIAWVIKYRIILEAAGKVVALFLVVILGLALLLFTLLPPIDPEHKPDVKLPRSFEDLKR